MATFVGLDVGLRKTSLCITDENQQVLLEVSIATNPEAIADAIVAAKTEPKLVGMEASGHLWLLASLRERGLPAIQIDAFRVRGYTKASPFKTDKNDARAISHMLRAGLFRKVYEKTPAAIGAQTLLAQRAAVQMHARSIKNSIRSALAANGKLLPPRSDRFFAARVQEAVADNPLLASAIGPALALWQESLATFETYSDLVEQAAGSDPVVKLLRTMPGVGAVSALAFRSAVDDPWRFTVPRDVGAYLGLVPGVFASGESTRRGRITRHGATYVRACMFLAARSHLFLAKQPTDLRSWAQSIRERRGSKRAIVALSRKMAVVLLTMWRTNQSYRPLRQTECDG